MLRTIFAMLGSRVEDDLGKDLEAGFKFEARTTPSPHPTTSISQSHTSKILEVDHIRTISGKLSNPATLSLREYRG
jgi:hypothetical protein